MTIAVFVQSSQMPSLPPWVMAVCLLAAVICFAPQQVRKPIPRAVICAVLLALAFGAIGYAVVAPDFDWCAASAADPSNWIAWFKCLTS